MISMTHSSRIIRDAIIGVVLFMSIALPLLTPSYASAQAPSGGAAASVNTPNARPTVCDGGLLSMSSLDPVCWFRRITAALGASIIQIAIWVLTVSGMLFNLLVDHTIINFGQFLYGSEMKSAIETAWTAFRDISNIVIIGMFVFMAIMTILGSIDYGYKKLVAKIIIIAVLINFSLLFTKIIIDFSNFAALQFYNAASLQASPSSTGAATDPNTTQQKGISGAFLDYMGVTGIGDSYSAVRKVAESSDSGGLALLHAIIASIFILAAAIVLFYGSFLLASRALLLIFLLLTSSIAFATYLIPIGVVNSTWGWKKWWSSLLQSAVFAPLLMIFLWVTLAIGRALKDQAGTLGDLLTNPTKGANYESLFGYIIVLGLLFISFKISSSFAAGIGGFNYAAMIPAGLAGIGARAAAMSTRWTVGAGGRWAGEKLQAQARNTNRSDLSRSLFDFGAKPFQALAKKDFNPLRNALGGQMAKMAGLKKETLGGEKVGGFEGTVKNFQKALGERAKNMTPTKEELEKQLEARKAATTTLKPEVPKPSTMAPPEDKKKDTETVRAEELKAYFDNNPKEKEVHEKAKEEVHISKEDMDASRRTNADVVAKLSQSIKGLKEQQATLRSNKADTVAIARADEIQKKVSESKVELGRALKERREQIREATKKSQVADEKLREIEKKAVDAMQDRVRTQQEQNASIKESDVKEKNTTEAIAQRLADKSLTGVLLKSLGVSSKSLSSGAVKHLKEQAKRERAKLNAEERKKLDDKDKPKSEPPAPAGDKH